MLAWLLFTEHRFAACALLDLRTCFVVVKILMPPVESGIFVLGLKVLGVMLVARCDLERVWKHRVASK